MSICPECRSEIVEGAQVCAACGRRIVGRPCPECAELSKEEASKCAWCGHNFAREKKIAQIEPFGAQAALVPTIVQRGRFVPQEIQLTPEKIVIRTWGVFKMSHTDEDIPWGKVAGYHYHSGWFWDRVEIMTRGQESNTMAGIPKDSGGRIRELLERMKE